MSALAAPGGGGADIKAMMAERIRNTLQYGTDNTGTYHAVGISLDGKRSTHPIPVLTPLVAFSLFHQFRLAGLGEMIEPVLPVTIDDALVAKLQAAFDDTHPQLKGETVPMARVLLSGLRHSQQAIYKQGILICNPQDEDFLTRAVSILSDAIPEFPPKGNLPLATARSSTDAAGYHRLFIDGQLQDNLILCSLQHALAKKLTSLEDLFRTTGYMSYGHGMSNGESFPSNAFGQITSAAQNAADLHAVLTTLPMDGTKPVEITKELALQIYPTTGTSLSYEPRELVLSHLKGQFPALGAAIEKASTRHQDIPSTLTLILPPEAQRPIMETLLKAQQLASVSKTVTPEAEMIKRLGVAHELAEKQMQDLKGSSVGAQLLQGYLSLEALKGRVGKTDPASGEFLYPKLHHLYDLLQQDILAQAYGHSGPDPMLEVLKMAAPDLAITPDPATGADTIAPAEHARASTVLRGLHERIDQGKLAEAESRLGSIEKRHTRALDKATAQAAQAAADAERQEGTRAAAERARREAEALTARTEKLRTTYGRDMDNIAAIERLIDDRLGANKSGNALGDRYIEKEGHVLINCASEDERAMLKDLLRGLAGNSKGFLMDIANPEKTHGLKNPLKVTDVALLRIRENIDVIRQPYHDALQAVTDDRMDVAKTKMQEASEYLAAMELNPTALAALERSGGKQVT